MGIEIERKFLVKNDSWRGRVEKSVPYEQGYLSDSKHCSVRVRIEGDVARLNVKSAGLDIQRLEYEYEIPVQDAREMLDTLCLDNRVSKQRHFIHVDEHVWELDEFLADNAGLYLAEVELGSRDEDFKRPDWLGDEVSGDPRYLNNNLARKPFKHW